MGTLGRAVKPLDHRHGFLLAKGRTQVIAQRFNCRVNRQRGEAGALVSDDESAAGTAIRQAVPRIMRREFIFFRASTARVTALRKSSPRP